jgi:hypothetical protein
VGRRIGAGLAVAALAFSTVVLGATGAGAAPAGDAAEACRQIDDAGELALLGVTRGECVNLLKGPSSGRSDNFAAAFCGLDDLQLLLGGTNKGQCIKALRTIGAG